MVNVHGNNVKCGDIHGKEFLNYSKCFWSKCSMSPRSWWRTRMKSMARTKFNGKSIFGHVCHFLVMKQSIVKAQSLYLLGFCCASESFFNITNPTKLGRTELQESDPRKATETMLLSMESRLNSSGTSSQDSQRCSSVRKSVIHWATRDKHQKLSQEEFYLSQCSMTSLVTEKATKMNAWQMPKSWKYLR